MSKVKCFPPIINNQSKILILGTAPGKESLKKSEYYGNSNNYFWDIIYRIFCKDWKPFDYVDDRIMYEDKKKIILDNKLALWDVISQCEREGSSDKKITNETINQFDKFLSAYPNVNKIIFNGIGSTPKSAIKLFTLHYHELLSNFDYRALNSTSPQNPNNPFLILEEWQQALMIK